MTDMAVGDGAFASPSFTIGAAIGQTFGVFRRVATRLLPIALVAMLPTLLSAYYFSTIVRYPAGIGGAVAKFVHSLPDLAISDTCEVIARVIIFCGASQQMRGQGFPIGQSLSAALRRLPAALGLMVATELLSVLGLVLLVVPGGMFTCAAYVAFPVCVLEKSGVFPSITRSFHLTRGHRWRIFGLLLVVIVTIALIALPGRFLLMGGFSPRAATPTMPILLYNWVVRSIATSFGAVLVMVVYRQLRVAKEGIDSEAITGVFD
jgi:hypothetical protein